MRTIIGLLSLSFALAFAVPSAFAARCGTAKNPSWNSRCSCPSKSYSAVWTRKFKKVSFNLNAECSRAASAARKKLSRSWVVTNFRWKKIASKVRNVLGYKKGWCKVRVTARLFLRKKRRLYNSRLTTRIYTSNGKTTWKKKGLLLGKQKACARARSSARRYVAKKYNAVVVSLRQRAYSYKRTPFYARCTIKWTARYRKRVKRYGYYCSR